MLDVRKEAVANLFYPGDKINLKRMINTYLSGVPSDISDFTKKNNIDKIYGIISPHAGYAYSGQVAAFSYSLLRNKSIDTILIIGPSHYTYFQGFALSQAKAFSTPLGKIPIDKDLAEALIKNGNGSVDYLDTAHIKEHCIEVQLPFLQETLINNFKILPLLMGEQTTENIKAGIDVLKKTLEEYERSVLIVISTDLSHYHPDEQARSMDTEIMHLLESSKWEKLMSVVEKGEVEACGAGPISVLMGLAKKMGWDNIKHLIYRNSGDTSGERDKVVGYLSSIIW